MASIGDERKDVCISYFDDDRLPFTEQNAKTSRSFVKNYCLEALNDCWRDKHGVGVLSIHAGNVDTHDEGINAILQTRGGGVGGVAVCFLSKSYLSDTRCKEELKAALRYASDGRSGHAEQLSILLFDLGGAKDSLQHNAAFLKRSQERFRLHDLDFSATELDAKYVSYNLAERVVEVLSSRHHVAGGRIKESFSNLLQIIGMKAEASRLALSLDIGNSHHSAMDVLRAARNKGAISTGAVGPLQQALQINEGPEFVESYTRKWLDQWAKRAWPKPPDLQTLIQERNPSANARPNLLQPASNFREAASRAGLSSEQQLDINDAGAIFKRGVRYANGAGVKKNMKLAAELYKEAAAKGDARAMNYLAVCYENGAGVPRDVKHAVVLYKQAVGKRNARAMSNLGLCYEHGKGVDKCMESAVKLYRQAEREGDASAIKSLGMCYEKGAGVEKDVKFAWELYREAAEKGDTTAATKVQMRK